MIRESEGEGGAVGGDGEGGGAAEDEGVVVGAVVAGGVVEADGVGVFRHGIADDFLGGGAEGDGVVVHVAHLPHDEACQARKASAAFEVHHHAVDVVEVFVEVFDEEYLAVGVDVGGGAAEAVEYGEVAADELTVSGACAVEGLGGKCVGERFAEEGLAEGVDGGVGGAEGVGGYVEGHGGMEGLDAEVVVDVAVEDGDVAVADNPFGVLAEVGEIEAVDDADGAVAATGAEDGTYSGVVQLLLEGEGAGGVVAGKLVVGIEKVVGQHHVELPRTEQVDGGFYLLG